MSAERGHVLVITKSDDWHEDQPDFDSAIECQSVEKCGGWWECMDPHEVDGDSAADGPWECDLNAPWNERDEFTFHGFEHTWRYGFGWTVPYEGCIVAQADSVSDYAHDIGHEHGPGRYLVDDDWDDTDCTLIYVSEAP